MPSGYVHRKLIRLIQMLFRTAISIHNSATLAMLSLVVVPVPVVGLGFLIPKSGPLTTIIAVSVLLIVVLPLVTWFTLSLLRYNACLQAATDSSDSIFPCPFCGYPVTQTDVLESCCPECGAVVPSEGLQQYWRQVPVLFKRFRFDGTLLRQCGISPPNGG